MNVKLLKQIKAHILAEPNSFRMDTWTCGTAHCIAGWALVLNDIPIVNTEDSPMLQRTVSGETPRSVAMELLRISPSEASGLFHVSQWPYDLARRHDEASWVGDRVGAARVAAKRIDRFIGGRV